MTRRAQLWWGIGAILAAVALGVAVTISGKGPSAIDAGWNDIMVEIRGPFLIGAAVVLDRIGGGWTSMLLIPALALVALLVARRWRAAVLVGAALLLSALSVQVLKSLFARSRPDEMLVLSDFGSFPSGHTANAATLVTLAVLLFPRAWVRGAAIAWVVVMAVSRTLVSAHWLTDTVGGMLMGTGVALVVAALLRQLWPGPAQRDPAKWR